MSRERFDDSLDAYGVQDDLRRALAIDPSPEFMPRVRARIAAERGASGAWLGWRAALAGAALGTVAIGAVWHGNVARPPLRPQTEEVRRGRDIALATEPAREIVRVRAASIDPPAARAGRAVRAEPEILVPPDAARALARVLELARTGALHAAAAPPADAPVPEGLEIAPIVVPSVPVVNVDSETVLRDAEFRTTWR